MATYYVSASASGSGDGSISSPWTCDQARRLASAGDIIQLRGGTYSESSTHTLDNSGGGAALGSSGAWITWQAYPSETPILTKRARIENLSYYRFEDITFHSYGDPWITNSSPDNPADHIYLDGCSFDEISSGASYSGLYLQGCSFVTLDGCSMEKWHNGDGIRFDYGSRILIKNCDFPEAEGNHSVIMMKNITRSVIHRNWFRNPIDRAIAVVERSSGDSENVIVQWNVFLDNDWNGSDPHPLDGTDLEWERGANQAARFACRRGIFRFNLVARTNIGKDVPWASQLDISFYPGSHDAAFMRIYHNVIHQGQRNGVTFEWNSDIGNNFEDLDIRFINNCITQNNNYAIYIAKTILNWRTYRFLSNVIADTRKSSTIFIKSEVPEAVTVSSAESKYAQVFKNNLSGYPSYVNQGLLATMAANPSSYGVEDIDDAFAAMQLNSGSVGENAGQALATVTAAGTGITDISVTDAIPFTDGWGLVERDEIYIGSNLVEVVARLSDTSIRVTPAINVSVGDPVYHSDVGSSTPSIGLPTAPFDVTDPGVPPAPPPVLGTDDTPPEDDEDDIISDPPDSNPIGTITVVDADFPNANPILQKPSLRLSLGGVSGKSPLLSGLAGTISLDLAEDERLISWRIFSDSFENQLDIDDQFSPSIDIVFGTDTDTSDDGVRNVIEWITDRGTTKRQLWVKNPPQTGGIYIGNQEAQSAGATFSIAAGEPLTFGINILPDFADEFFAGHHYIGNRYANTVRSWGGALTAEVWLDGSVILEERYIGDIHGYYWESPSSGVHPVAVRLRAAQGSSYYIELTGSITIQLS